MSDLRDVNDEEPREPGIIFGRGDELPDDAEEPPFGLVRVPGYRARVPFGSPPDQPVELVGEIPWELQDPPQTKPIIL